MDIFAWSALFAAAFGVVPILVCAAFSEMMLLCADGAVTLSGILHATTTHTNTTGGADEEDADAIIEVVNATNAVLFTLTVASRVRGYRTIVGALRTLWLVAIVTSSCSFASVRALSPRLAPAIPNDLTIIALAVGVFFLCAAFCTSLLCRKQDRAIRDERVVTSEVLLIMGALSVRYQTNIDEIAEARTRAGWAAWSLCCHTLVLIIVRISKRDGESNLSSAGGS